MKIYCDACVLNRLTDDQGQERIRQEARAVEEIVAWASTGKADLVGSTVLELELRLNPDLLKRLDALFLLSIAKEMFHPDADTSLRGTSLETHGYGAFDALHLACAEQMRADVLLTTDDRFLTRARRGVGEPKVRLCNPVDWLKQEIAMSTLVHTLTDEQFEIRALSLLEREFGVDGVARFLRLNRSGSGDYTVDREQWLANRTVADIRKELA